MQIQTSVARLLYLFFLGAVSLLCSVFALHQYAGSHLHRVVETGGWFIGLILCVLLVGIAGAPFYSTKPRALVVICFLFFGAFAGEAYYRFSFHLLVLSFLAREVFLKDTVPAGRIRWITTALFLVQVSGLSTFMYYEFDHVLFLDIFRNASSLRTAFSESSLWNIRREVIYSLEFLSLGFVLERFIRDTDTDVIKKQLSNSVILALLLVPLYLLLQIYAVHPFFLINQNAFWDFSRRFSAIYSDPNAFGIMSGIILLLIPFLFSNRLIVLITTLLVIFSSSFSGSRTFFFFAVAFILVYINRLRGSARLSERKLLFAALCLVISGCILMFHSTASFRRLSDTLHPEKIVSMLESRLLFSRIASAAIAEKPFHGVGLGRFYTEQVRISELLDLDLDVWRDNANNYYLHIAAEQGIPALILVLLAFYLILKVSVRTSSCSRYGPVLLIFILSLLSGPHIFFLEVRAVFLLLAGLYISGDTTSGTTNPSHKILLFSACVFIICSPWWYDRSMNFGLYNTEGANDMQFAWTGSTAELRVIPSDARFLYLKNPLYDFYTETEKDSAAELVFVTRDNILYRYETVFDSAIRDSWQIVTIPENLDHILISSPGVVIPREEGISDDSRLLGLQIRLSPDNILE
jgi:hypothetical protein